MPPKKKAKQNALAERFEPLAQKIHFAFQTPIGIIVLLIVFSVIGAVLFKRIEQTNEQAVKREWYKHRESLIEKLFNYTKQKGIKPAAWKQLARSEVRSFEEELLEAFGSGVTDDNFQTTNWDFFGSLFYCGTVYTTIGYGNIYPVTRAGKILTIIYAVIGIPLCLIVLAEIGKIMTVHLKQCVALYLNATKRKPKRGAQPDPPYDVNDEFNFCLSFSMLIMLAYIIAGAFLFTLWEDWDFLDSFYFVFITISTIGFGDVLPGQPNYFLATFVYLFGGLAIVSMALNIVMEQLQARYDFARDHFKAVCAKSGIKLTEESEAESNAAQTPPEVLPNAAAADPSVALENQEVRQRKPHAEVEATSVETATPAKRPETPPPPPTPQKVEAPLKIVEEERKEPETVPAPQETAVDEDDSMPAWRRRLRAKQAEEKQQEEERKKKLLDESSPENQRRSWRTNVYGEDTAKVGETSPAVARKTRFEPTVSSSAARPTSRRFGGGGG